MLRSCVGPGAAVSFTTKAALARLVPLNGRVKYSEVENKCRFIFIVYKLLRLASR